MSSEHTQLAARVAELEAQCQALAGNLASLVAITVVQSARVCLLAKHIPTTDPDDLRQEIERVILMFGDKMPIEAEALRADVVKLGFQSGRDR